MADFSKLEKDLCERTLVNLEFIKEAKQQDKKVFEVTQLFDSLLGIIVNIKEQDGFLGELYNLKLNQSVKNDWGIPQHIESDSIGSLIYDVRNAVAHIDVEFLTKESSEIKSVTFHFDNGTKSRGKMTFSVIDLEKFVKSLCSYVIEHGE